MHPTICAGCWPGRHQAVHQPHPGRHLPCARQRKLADVRWGSESGTEGLASCSKPASRQLTASCLAASLCFLAHNCNVPVFRWTKWQKPPNPTTIPALLANPSLCAGVSVSASREEEELCEKTARLLCEQEQKPLQTASRQCCWPCCRRPSMQLLEYSDKLAPLANLIALCPLPLYPCCSCCATTVSVPGKCQALYAQGWLRPSCASAGRQCKCMR